MFLGPRPRRRAGRQCLNQGLRAIKFVGAAVQRATKCRKVSLAEGADHCRRTQTGACADGARRVDNVADLRLMGVGCVLLHRGEIIINPDSEINSADLGIYTPSVSLDRAGAASRCSQL